VICSDKTGTLTRNEMTVQQVALPHETLQVTGVGYATQGELHSQSSHLGGKASTPSVFIDDSDALWSLLEAAVLCNDARFLPAHAGQGVPIARRPDGRGLADPGAKAGIDAQMLRNANPDWPSCPSSRARFMATLNLHEGQPRLFIKGAPERILPRCDRPTGTATDAWQQRADEMARAGLRLLAFAVHATAPQPGTDSSPYLAADALPPSGGQLLGLVGMVDPAREEAKSAVAECQRAGIRIVMITATTPARRWPSVSSWAWPMSHGYSAAASWINSPTTSWRNRLAGSIFWRGPPQAISCG
jgi:Ca2+-transporting ATPase